MLGPWTPTDLAGSLAYCQGLGRSCRLRCGMKSRMAVRGKTRDAAKTRRAVPRVPERKQRIRRQALPFFSHASTHLLKVGVIHVLYRAAHRIRRPGALRNQAPVASVRRPSGGKNMALGIGR